MRNQKIWTEIEKVIDSFISSDWIDEVKLKKELKGHFKARFCPEEKREKLEDFIRTLIDGFKMCKGHDSDCSCAKRLSSAVLAKILEVVDEVRIELLTTSTSLINKDVLKAKLKELVD